MTTAQSRVLHPRSWPIAVRMTVDLLLAALVPLSIALWIAVSRSRSELERASQHSLQVLAQGTADHVDAMIGEASRHSTRLALDDDIVALCVAAAAGESPDLGPSNRALTVTDETNPLIASAFVMGRDAVGLSSTNARNIGQDLSFREYAVRALAGETYISELVIGKTTGEPGVYCSAPIRHPETGDVVGAAVVKMRGESVWELIDSRRLPPSSFAAIVDDNGVVIAVPESRRDFLFCSLGALTDEEIIAIDPGISYSRDTIPSLGLSDLLRVARAPDAAGSVSFTAPRDSPDSVSRRRVGGFAALSTRPWKAFVIQDQVQADAAASALLRSQLAVAGGVSVLAAGLAVARARSIVRPIRELAVAAETLGAGDFSVRAPKHADDELGRLADEFNRMAPRLEDAVELKQALEVAMEVQQNLLPARDPDLRQLDIAGRTRYCDETGGDYYDFIDIAPSTGGDALVAVGDVMGHGVGAALLMASARAALRALVLEGEDLASLLNRVNKVLYNERDSRFMTLALVHLEPASRRVRWASAGHDPTIVYRPATGDFEELDGAGIPLGIDDSYSYQDYRRESLAPGEVLVIGTDGVWEAPGPGGTMFEKHRLRDVIRANHDRPAAEIASAIERAVDDFRGAEAQKDDITFVVIKVAPDV